MFDWEAGMVFELDCMFYRVQWWLYNKAKTNDEFKAAHALLNEIMAFQSVLLANQR